MKEINFPRDTIAVGECVAVVAKLGSGHTNAGDAIQNCRPKIERNGERWTAITTPHPMRAAFRQIMRERREYRRGDLEFDWRTRAARKFVWSLRGVPTSKWSE